MRLATGLALSTAMVIGAVCDAAEPRMAAYQQELLELAYSGVSEMPLSPHIKNRSRAQLKTARACLELNNPELAETFVAGIRNWQQSMGYADIAAYYAEQGMDEQAQAFIGKVTPALRMSEDIRSGKVAFSTPNPLIDTLVDRRYEAVLTRVEEVRRMGRAAEPAEAQELAFGTVNAAHLNAGAAAERAADTTAALAALEPFIAHDNFEIAYYGFHELARVIERHYDEVDLNRMLEQVVKPRLTKVPVFLRIELYLEYAGLAARNRDMAAVAPILSELEGMVDGLKPRPRYYIPESVRVLKLMIEIGELEKAAAQVDALLAYYNEKRDLIVNIERAELVCGLAETYHLLGQDDVALNLYRRAVDEGMINPNSRPQADDLNRICCSLALHEVKPDDALLQQLNAMRSGLGNPW